MKIEVLKHYTVLLEKDKPISLWSWGFKKHQITANRRYWGKHGFTLRINTTLIIITLPGKGRLNID